MINVGGLIAGNSAINLMYRAGDVFDINERRRSLANRIRPDMTSEETLALHREDKALSLQAAMAEINAEVGYAMEAGYQENKRKRQAKAQQA